MVILCYRRVFYINTVRDLLLYYNIDRLFLSNLKQQYSKYLRLTIAYFVASKGKNTQSSSAQFMYNVRNFCYLDSSGGVHELMPVSSLNQ